MQVPYQPYPTHTPQFQATPGVHVQAFPAAFGANIGSALEGLGKVTEQAGNELFSRAVALQNLNNETEAREADAQYMMKAGLKHEQFKATFGKSAVQGLDDHLKELNELRQKFRSGLSNDMARKMYDASSLSTLSRNIIGAAGHAGAQQKQWVFGTAKAGIEASKDQALSMPTDDVAFQKGLNDLRERVGVQADAAGWDDTQANQELAKQTSSLWAQRIKGLAHTQPYQAQKMLDDARQKGAIRGEDLEPTTNFVRQRMYTTGARNIAHTVSTGDDLAPGSGVVTMDRAKQAISQFESGGDYQAKGPMTKHGVALGKYQVMTEFLPEFLKEAGMKPMTPEEFLKDKDAQEELFASRFGDYMKKYGSFNEAAKRWIGTVGKDALGTDAAKYLQETNRNLAKTQSLGEKQDRAAAMAKDQAPFDPTLQDYTIAQVDAMHHREKAAQADEDFRNTNTVNGALVGNFGKIPTTVDELKASSPDVARAWDNLNETQQKKIIKDLGRVKAVKDDLTVYQRLTGMAQEDPAEFLSHDVLSEAGLSDASKKHFINLQSRLKANAETDPRVTHALQVLQGQMFSAGVTKAQDKERYYQFTGALQDALDAFQGETKKRPDFKQVQEIGAHLLQEQTTPGWLWNSHDPMFEVPVPGDEAEKIKADSQWAKTGIVPTDDMIRRVYVRSQYQKLYGGAATKPQVPR